MCVEVRCAPAVPTTSSATSNKAGPNLSAGRITIDRTPAGSLRSIGHARRGPLGRDRRPAQQLHVRRRVVLLVGLVVPGRRRWHEVDRALVILARLSITGDQ